MRWIATFITEAWALIAPFWRSEERWRARLLLGVVIALNLSLVGMTVLLTYWQRAFYNTLESKDWDGFIALLFTWHRTEAEGFLPGFILVAALYILIAVYQLYLRQALQMRWRRWLTWQACRAQQLAQTQVAKLSRLFGVSCLQPSRQAGGGLPGAADR